MRAITTITLVLLIVGGLNWGLVGLFGFDLVAAIFGEMSLLSRIVYSLVGLSALWQLMWPLLLGYAVLGTAWHVLGVASPLQGSPGKRAFGLRVVDLQGARPRFARALGRHLAAGLSWLTLNIGHLVALPSPHRALHDRIAGTRVLRDADTRRLPRTATAWIALQLLAALVLLAWLLRRYVVALDAAFG